MEKILNQKHSTDTLYYSLTRILQSVAFYGISAILVLYMTGETLQMERNEAFEFYGLVLSSVLFSSVVGALVGDLLIGNKKAMIIGIIVQALGAFVLSIPSSYGLYAGFFLMVVGSGFFTPNILSNYGKMYLKTPKLLDAGFTIFYVTFYIGSFIGALLIGYLREKQGFSIAFLFAGLLSLVSLIPIVRTKDIELEPQERVTEPQGNRLLTIIMAILILGLFWGIYTIVDIRILDLKQQLDELLTLESPESIKQYLSSIFILPVSIIAVIIWTKVYRSQSFRLVIGFLSGAVALGFLMLIPDTPQTNHVVYFLLSMLFLAIAEIHIEPVIYSVLTKHSNPKYLATTMSLAFLLIRGILIGFGFLINMFFDDPVLGFTLGIILMILVSVGIVIYKTTSRNTYNINQQINKLNPQTNNMEINNMEIKKINSLTIVGIVLNTLILVYTFLSPRYNVLTPITAIALLICIVGLVLMVKDKVKLGSILFYIGSVIFIPIGIIGILGVRKTVSELQEEKFNKENYE